jgi:hypothetical protein
MRRCDRGSDAGAASSIVALSFLGAFVNERVGCVADLPFSRPIRGSAPLSAASALSGRTPCKAGEAFASLNRVRGALPSFESCLIEPASFPGPRLSDAAR